MTGELHNMFIRAGMKAFQRLPFDEQKALLGVNLSQTQMQSYITYTEQNPRWQDEMDERAMRIIHAAAEKIDPEKYKKLI